MTELLLLPRDQYLTEASIRAGMDLLFFANTRHLKRADEMLAENKIGRAHHRIMYFVARRPDMPVFELLRILGVTKQSFYRPAKELMKQGLMVQLHGQQDRRQRLLRLTSLGIELERAIFVDLHDNVARAYHASGGDAVAGFWQVLQHLMGNEARAQFRMVQQL